MVHVIEDGAWTELVICPSSGEVRFQTNFEREGARIC